jgi:peroxiredoxin Q/BCP
MLKVGQRAPDFALADQDGQTVRLSECLADGPVLLYFYPADFTPGCTKEACDIRDMYEDISDVGIRVIGVSPQDEDSHTRFRQKHRLPFTLLTDPSKTVVKAYGVDGPLGFGVRRATFLIGQDRRIEDVVMADLLIDRHSDFIRQAVARQKG